MQTVDLIGKEAQGNSSIIEQLVALRATLDSIEEKVEPSPAPVPDTFAEGKIYFSPIVEQAGKVKISAHSFDKVLYQYGEYINRLSDVIPTKSNKAAWVKAMEKMRLAWSAQVESLRSQVDMLGWYASHVACMITIACEGEVPALDGEQAMLKEACHE